MDITELKLVTASNIIRLRNEAGITQAKLGAMLNYSDKTVSKWERGEAIPDAFVLTQLAEIFGVSVDYLLSSHDGWEGPKTESPVVEQGISLEVLMALVVVSVWTTAIAIFVVLWFFDIVWWEIFSIVLPVSALTLVVLMCAFKKRRYLQYAISAFVLSIFIMLYVLLPRESPWPLMVLAVPSIAIVFLACNIKRRPLRRFRRKQKSQ